MGADEIIEGTPETTLIEILNALENVFAHRACKSPARPMNLNVP
jgi:hypothetical protein